MIKNISKYIFSATCLIFLVTLPLAIYDGMTRTSESNTSSTSETKVEQQTSDLTTGNIDGFFVNRKVYGKEGNHEVSAVSNVLYLVTSAQDLYDGGITSIPPSELPTYDEFIKLNMSYEEQDIFGWWLLEVIFSSPAFHGSANATATLTNVDNNQSIISDNKIYIGNLGVYPAIFNISDTWYVAYKITGLYEYSIVNINLFTDDNGDDIDDSDAEETKKTNNFTWAWDSNSLMNQKLKTEYNISNFSIIDANDNTEIPITNINLVNNSFYFDGMTKFMNDLLHNRIHSHLEISFQNVNPTSSNTSVSPTSTVTSTIPASFDAGEHGTNEFVVYSGSNGGGTNLTWLWIMLGVMGGLFAFRWLKERKNVKSGMETSTAPASTSGEEGYTVITNPQPVSTTTQPKPQNPSEEFKPMNDQPVSPTSPIISQETPVERQPDVMRPTDPGIPTPSSNTELFDETKK